ncbi:MAG: septation protein A [Caldimonas sp.]|uniref:septation protein A n=1 Tax=Caldimonas sp. TaxID=2838790 RepID=UPI003919FECF
MKLFFDFLPLILFFGSFKLAESRPGQAAELATAWFGPLAAGAAVDAQAAPVLLATAVVMAATAVQIGVLLARGRRVDAMLWVSLVLVLVLGGATLWFHSETFIKWKPSVLYWIMGASLWVSQVVLRHNLLHALMGGQIDLPASVWQRLNFAWIAFFGLMGLLNVYVAYSYPTAVWVNFKVFGSLGLMLLFLLAQAVYLSRHLKNEEPS